MTIQTLTTRAGERLVVIPEADYQALVDAAENASDLAAVHAVRRAVQAGTEEMIPAEVVNRLVEGQNPVRVWRQYRGFTSAALAAKAGIGQGYLSQIETGKRDGTLGTARKIAAALSISLNDLVG